MSTEHTILIAEDNDMSRELMAGVLENAGFKIVHANSGMQAIKALKEHNIDMAFVDLNMSPVSGFEFVSYLIANTIPLPTVIVTASESSDILTRANELRVTRLLQKPVDPERLITVAKQVLQRYKGTEHTLASETLDIKLSPEKLMKRAIEIAEQNVKNGKGRAFGAIVASADGDVLGQGTNGITSRVDPIAHAEIMAIRHAAEKLGRADLSDCILYCTGEPTMMGKALIISVGIKTVYYGLTHDEIRHVRAAEDKVRAELSGANQNTTSYIQLCHDEVLSMFKDLQDQGTD